MNYCPNKCWQGHLEFEEKTTTSYNGFISLIRPAKSWVAKWNEVNNRVMGIYAIKVGDWVM
jgi:RNA polymerase subunit RPABC4/transcription elongation factor Spt4